MRVSHYEKNKEVIIRHLGPHATKDASATMANKSESCHSTVASLPFTRFVSI